MRQIEKARPGLAAGGRAAMVATVASGQLHSTTIPRQSVALAVQKRGRLCIVAKITHLDGEPILAVTHRRQHGVAMTISIPAVALRYAQDRGCRWLYFRRDSTGEMRRISLADVQRPGIGWLKTSCGIPEWFIKLDRMEPVAWRPWPYAERTVELQAEPQPVPDSRQLTLWSAMGG